MDHTSILTGADVWSYWRRIIEDQTYAERGEEGEAFVGSMGQSEFYTAPPNIAATRGLQANYLTAK